MGTKLLTTSEVAKLLGVHANTVRAMADDGRLVGVKTGEKGHWRFSAEEVQKYLSLADNPLQNKVYYMLNDIPNDLIENEKNVPLWEFIQKYYGIRAIFGSLAVNTDKLGYLKLIDGKSLVWLGEGAVNFSDVVVGKKYTKDNKATIIREKFIWKDVRYGLAVMEMEGYFGTVQYSVTTFLVVKDADGVEWVVDGTLQQFHTELDKGLVIFPLQQAVQVYNDFTIYGQSEFSAIYGNEDMQEKVINNYKKKWQK